MPRRVISNTPGSATAAPQAATFLNEMTGELYPTALPFSATVPLDRAHAVMERRSITGPLAFTPQAPASRLQGALASYRLTANGIHEPTFPGFRQHASSRGWTAAAGNVNVVSFWWDGVDVWYSISGALATYLIPAPIAAQVTGNSLVVTFSEVLSGAPALSAFTVTVNGVTRALTGSAVLSAATVTLTLSGSAITNETVLVSYMPPETTPLVDADGNVAAGFGNQVVTIGGGGGGGGVGLFDPLSSAEMADLMVGWGTRRLRTEYAGNAVRIERWNAALTAQATGWSGIQRTIGFAANGRLATTDSIFANLGTDRLMIVRLFNQVGTHPAPTDLDLIPLFGGGSALQLVFDAQLNDWVMAFPTGVGWGNVLHSAVARPSLPAEIFSGTGALAGMLCGIHAVAFSPGQGNVVGGDPGGPFMVVSTDILQISSSSWGFPPSAQVHIGNGWRACYVACQSNAGILEQTARARGPGIAGGFVPAQPGNIPFAGAPGQPGQATRVLIGSGFSNEVRLAHAVIFRAPTEARGTTWSSVSTRQRVENLQAAAYGL